MFHAACLKIFVLTYATVFGLWKELPTSLLLRRFVVRVVEASAKREWLVLNRKGPWEGYRLLPAFLCAHILIERERRLAGYEAGSQQWCHYSPLQKLEGEWVQVFGETVSGIVWVDRCYFLIWLMVALDTINQS